MPRWIVSKEFSFEAAHSLPNLPVEHKCRNLHGHSYRVIVSCSGDLDHNSWVIDYADISAAAAPVIERLDHQNINDAILIASTAENLAFWIFQKLKPALGKILWSVQVNETEKTSVIYSES